jgi:hypothetical protein
MVHFFETVVVEDPNSQTNPPAPPPPPPPPPGGSLSEQGIKDAFALITPVSDPTDDNEIYDIVPDWISDAGAPIVGDLSDTYEANGLDTLNFMRSLAGLNPVAIDSSSRDKAQAGTDILAIISNVALNPHYPSYDLASGAYWDATETAGQVLNNDFFNLGYAGTSTSNIFAMTGGSAPSNVLADSIMLYFEDSDTSNIAVLGHRRWCLNPKMATTAFGRALNNDGDVVYMSMISTNQGSSAAVASGYVAWPSPVNGGKFPAEVFADSSYYGYHQAWSVSLLDSAYDTSSTSGITVTLINSTDSWTFDATSPGSGNPSGAYFNVDTQNVGIPYCIIFRPDGSVPLVGETYSVEITGIKDSGGSPTTITYDIEFFSLSSP